MQTGGAELDKLAALVARDTFVLTSKNLQLIVDSVSLISILDNVLLTAGVGAGTFSTMFSSPLSSHKKSELSFMNPFTINLAATQALQSSVISDDQFSNTQSLNGIPLICSGLDLVEACICRAIKTPYKKCTGFLAEDTKVC